MPLLKPRRRCAASTRSEEHTSELQSRLHLVCRLLLEKITDKTILISAMYANGEVGSVQPIREIGDIDLYRKIIFHVDGSCAFFFFNDTATTEIYTLSQHDALPI